MKFLVYLLIFGVIYFFVNKFLSCFKYPKLGSVGVFVGGLKKGKTCISLACALHYKRQAVRNWTIRYYFSLFLFKLGFKRFELNLSIPKPVLYSSIPLSCEYVPLTRDILLMRERIIPHSVVFFDEVSLIADSQLIRDKEINDNLLRFFKLFGHISHGGKAIFCSHTLTDMHYAIKRCVSEYFYVHQTYKLPFISVCKIREERYSEDGTTVNTFNEDIEVSVKTCLFSSAVFKYYDCYAYSILTDDLPIKAKVISADKNRSLKAIEIPSFNPAFYNMFLKERKYEKESNKNS